QDLLAPGIAVVCVMHTNIDTVDEALAVVGSQWEGPLGVYAHNGTFRSPVWEFDGLSPEEYAAEALGWVTRGVQVVGGCCGTRPEHIRRLKEILPPSIPFACAMAVSQLLAEGIAPDGVAIEL